MTNKEVATNIIKKLLSDDVYSIGLLMTEEAENKNDFLIHNIKQLKNICEEALKEFENDK